MPKTYSNGLTITAPTKGDTNWAPVEDAKNIRISGHDHTGGGMGTQIGSGALASDSVNSTKIRLGNNTSLRARNAADNADVNLLKLGADNVLDILAPLKLTSTETLTSSGAIALTTLRTILDGTSLAMTLAAGSDGQLKLVTNIATTAAKITPSVTVGPNTVTLRTGGAVLYCYISSEWRVVSLQGGIVIDDVETITASGAANVTPTTRRIIANYTGGATKTLQPSAEGYELDIVNINVGNAVFVGSVTAGTNQATLVTNGSVRYMYQSGEWRAIAGPGCTLA